MIAGRVRHRCRELRGLLFGVPPSGSLQLANHVCRVNAGLRTSQCQDGPQAACPLPLKPVEHFFCQINSLRVSLVSQHCNVKIRELTSRAADWLGVFCIALLSFLPLGGSAQVKDAPVDQKLAAEEKDGCERNLKIIREAIQAYVHDHKDIPNWLSDLVPQYISDANVLTCPVCKRTGQIESGALADPKMPCSYLYEFCPVLLGKALAPGEPNATRREWKRRQMGLVGSIVPIVRCRHHEKILNLAFDGRIYESPTSWEDNLTNQINIEDLKPTHLFAAAAVSNAAPAKLACPPRDPAASPGLLDLSAFYNAALTESWHGVRQKNSLSSLPDGLQTFAGVQYDVRGIIQLGSKSPAAKRFPLRVRGIGVNQKCARLHFLHAAAYGTVGDDGKLVGSYIVHFARNKMQLEIPIVYGRDVRNWHSFPNEKPSDELTVAWTGTNQASAAMHRNIRLFTTTWSNVAPNVEIKSIDFVSASQEPAPFLIAITAD
jgi:hypothetical protein